MKWLLPLVVCLGGCSAIRHEGTLIDNTYRKRVHQFSCPIGVQIYGVNVGASPTWTYNLPEPSKK